MVIELGGVQFLSEIMRVARMILESDERAARARLEITIKNYDSRPKLRDMTLLQPFWNHRIQSVPIYILPRSQFVEKRKQKGLKSHF